MTFVEVATLLKSKGAEGAIHELFVMLTEVVKQVEEIKQKLHLPVVPKKDK